MGLRTLHSRYTIRFANARIFRCTNGQDNWTTRRSIAHQYGPGKNAWICDYPLNNVLNTIELNKFINSFDNKKYRNFELPSIPKHLVGNRRNWRRAEFCMFRISTTIERDQTSQQSWSSLCRYYKHLTSANTEIRTGSKMFIFSSFDHLRCHKYDANERFSLHHFHDYLVFTGIEQSISPIRILIISMVALSSDKCSLELCSELRFLTLSQCTIRR